ncbi:GntR family transcriptional regulator [Flagellimonas sp.]|uniref:GntR family transcriptional regulator n=1 Tax=Flagellimonas sp. TaxID=2058762 RepID=UPI003B501521
MIYYISNMIGTISLRDQISHWLQEQMLNGKIQSGQKLSLVQLSEDIQVSVTPIREALVQLVRAGIVRNINNRGFYIPQLSSGEAKNIYPAIHALEKLALEQSQISPSQITTMASIQSEFEKASDTVDAVRLDLQFHDSLVGNYKNEVVHNMLNDLKVRVFFYELQYMDDPKNHQKSVKGHHALLNSLIQKDVRKAAALLQENWDTSAKFIEDHYTNEKS